MEVMRRVQGTIAIRTAMLQGMEVERVTLMRKIRMPVDIEKDVERAPEAGNCGCV